jgi:hypothetical protein
VETDRDVVPSVPALVLQERGDTETHYASNVIEVTTSVDVTSEVFVIATPSWFETHQVDMALTWAAECVIRPRSDAAEITSEMVKTRVHVVVTIEVPEPHANDGYADDHDDGEDITFRSVATWSTEVVARPGCTATDEVEVDFRWSAYPLVDVIRVPAAAG